MRKPTSILILLVLVIMGLWAGFTYWFGMKAEQQYHALLEHASQGQYAKFVNESYRRGFMDSQAQTILEIQLPMGPNGEIQSYKVPLIQDITHGPFPISGLGESESRWQPVMAVIETRLAPGSELESHFTRLWSQFPELATLRDYSVLYLDGKGRERLMMPPFQRTFGPDEPVAVNWKGLSLQVDFANDLKDFSGSLSMPGMEARSKELTLQLGEVKLAFTANEGISGLWLGEGSFSLVSLEVTLDQDTEPQSLQLQGFSVNTATSATGDNINSQLGIRTELLKFDEHRYGPGNFEIEFRNFDAPALARLQESLREETGQAGQPPATTDQMKMLARYMEILPALLKKSPEIEIKQLTLKTSLGDLTGTARLAFDGTKAGAVNDFMALITGLTVQVDVKIGEGLLRNALTGIMEAEVLAELEELETEIPNEESEELASTLPGEEEIRALVAERIDEQLAALTEQKILVKEDRTFSAKASYEGGQITLNGRPLSLQDLILGD